MAKRLWKTAVEHHTFFRLVYAVLGPINLKLIYALFFIYVCMTLYVCLFKFLKLFLVFSLMEFFFHQEEYTCKYLFVSQLPLDNKWYWIP